MAAHHDHNHHNHKNVYLDKLKQILIDQIKNKSITYDPYRPRTHYDEIFENCFLGDSYVAVNKEELKRLDITHVLNACKGEKFSQVNTSQHYYDHLNIKFVGFCLMDFDNCKIEKYFNEASDFIHEALSEDGRVLVHCFMGVSRSATLLIAYLIKHRNMSLEEALKMVGEKRTISPNDGFLLKLIEWEHSLKKD